MHLSSARTILPLLLTAIASFLVVCAARAFQLEADGYHVRPGESIQEALQAATRNATVKTVKVHAGEYRPDKRRQALIWFNRAHDGIRLEAVGRVVLTAANPELSAPGQSGHPAVVNHVVYFGDGISSNTVLRGFVITGANGFITRGATREIEPNQELPKGLFFYSDGGGIKVFGRSYPTILEVEVSGNFTSPCGAGISIEHGGFTERSVLIQDCVFRNNRTRVTGAALDLLPPGSAARVINCLFEGNVSNLGGDIVSEISGERPFTNSGAVTVFPNSRLILERCTFTANRNGVDDLSGQGIYRDSIFWKNNVEGGLPTTIRYALDLPKGADVRGCFIEGTVTDPSGSVARSTNTLNAPVLEFDSLFVPRDKLLEGIGYRPTQLQREFLSFLAR